MTRLKSLLLSVAWIFSAQQSEAQTNYNSWFRGTLTVPIEKKWNIDAETQYRRQSGWENKNMFNQPLMFSLRNWVHFSPTQSLKFSVSPFAYFSHTNSSLSHAQEFRITLAASILQPVFKRWFFIHRIAGEYRLLSSYPTGITRWRSRWGMRFDVHEKVKISFNDEVFLNVTGVQNSHLYDQNRIGINLDYRIFKGFNVEIAYWYISKLPLLSTVKRYENSLALNVTYQLQHSVKR